jgi:hypothetical protein
MAAMMMIATTISSSISVSPSVLHLVSPFSRHFSVRPL